MSLYQSPKHQRSLGSNISKSRNKLSAVTANLKRTNTVQEENVLFYGFFFFFLPYLVFRKSSIFLQRLKRVNNQEHAAGRVGKRPENMGVRQGNV